jgi:signal transduction histidine kinase
MKNAAKMTLLSTALLAGVFTAAYLLLITDLNASMLEAGLDYRFGILSVNFLIILFLTVFLAYVISYLLIDNILNPIRLMIAKLREIEKMNFSKPLVIHTGDDELREYVSAFNSMSQKLSGYIERQKRFISDASHELTTPITIINGHADLLLRRWKEQPKLLDNSLPVIQTEALRMSGLVDSLLLLARSDRGKQEYTFALHDLMELIRESMDETRLIAPDFDVRLMLPDEEPVFILCDAYAIRRVLRIILSNAVKYSEENKRITITAHSSHGLAAVCIKDSGIGIPSEHLPRIFDRFYRVDDSRAKKTGSSGLGLAIAKEIITAHGGEIEASGEAGEGTAFTVTLPS